MSGQHSLSPKPAKDTDETQPMLGGEVPDLPDEKPFNLAMPMDEDAEKEDSEKEDTSEEEEIPPTQPDKAACFFWVLLVTFRQRVSMQNMQELPHGIVQSILLKLFILTHSWSSFWRQ